LEEEIWGMTPRKFKSQLDVHKDIQQQMNGISSSRDAKAMQKSMKKQVQSGYIDQVPNW
jgi:hypothetical protein